KAIADYNEAIRLDPKNVEAYSSKGLAWSKKKDHDRAMADYNEAIRLDANHAAAYRNRGFTWLSKKEYDKAIADYNEAIRLDPKYAGAYNGRAWLWATCPDAKFRDGKMAFESASQACQLTDWKEPNYIGTLSAAYAETGDFEKAATYQENAIGLLT